MRYLMIVLLTFLPSACLLAGNFEAEISLKEKNSKAKFDRIIALEIEDGQYIENGEYQTSAPTITRVATASDTEEVMSLVQLCVAWGGVDFNSMVSNKANAAYQLKCEMEQGDINIEAKLYFNDLKALPAAIQERFLAN
jgi:hypothetical protein